MLLQNVIPFDYQICEDIHGKRSKRPGVLLAVEGRLQYADKENANRRVYPRRIFEKIMIDEEIIDKLKHRSLVGELGHPASGKTSEERISHVVVDHQLCESGEVKGKLEVLDTPMGKIAETLFKAGVRMGVSSRGDGSVEKKGELDEVQDDYNFKTYDLVIDPSTYGAYPQIVESVEDQKVNNRKIHAAIEGLVNKTDNLDVLLECHKIVGTLEASNDRDMLEEAIKVKIRKTPSESQSSTPKPEKLNDSTSHGDRMLTKDQIAGLNLSAEMATFLNEQIAKGVAEAVSKKDQEIYKLNERIVEMLEEGNDTKRHLDAAEQLIEEFQRKTRELSEQVKGDSVLEKRYNAAVRLLDEAINRLHENGSLRRKLRAAEKLLTASIERHQNEAINSAIRRKIARFDEATQKRVRPLLSECRTVGEVNRKFKMVQGILETRKTMRNGREPLPPRRKTITEGKSTPAKRQDSGDLILDRLLSRIN